MDERSETPKTGVSTNLVEGKGQYCHDNEIETMNLKKQMSLWGETEKGDYMSTLVGVQLIHSKTSE